MPKTKLEKMSFTLIVVVITVLAFVFYSTYVINGDNLMLQTGASSVMGAVDKIGGVYMFGTILPIWAVILIEIIFAFTLETFIVEKRALNMTISMANPESTPPLLFKVAMTVSIVSMMCPSMSLIAAFSFYPYASGFNILTLIANWFELICYNLPFVLLAQLFFIQPISRKIFGTISKIMDLLTNSNETKNA